MKRLPPINPGEVHIRCPQCQLVGWTQDGEPDEMPECPDCGVRAEKVPPTASGVPMICEDDSDPGNPHPLHREYIHQVRQVGVSGPEPPAHCSALPPGATQGVLAL